jgi:hypothetical protein
MKRKIISTERYKPMRTAWGSFGIRDTLECGHVITNKGSAGNALTRQCRHCDHLKSGGTSFIGNEEEKWNEKTQMPYRVKIK